MKGGFQIYKKHRGRYLIGYRSRCFYIEVCVSLLSCLGCTDSQNALHLVVNDHEAFVNTHTGLCQDLYGLGSHSAVYADLSTSVGLVAGTALVCADALLLAVKLYHLIVSLNPRLQK